MHSHTEKAVETKSPAIARQEPATQLSGEGAFGFEDHRAQSSLHEKIREKANAGPRAIQLKAFQLMADKHSDNQLPIQMVSAVIQRVPEDLDTDSELIKPGPPPTIHKGNYFYKVFTTQAQANVLKIRWDTVDAEGVLTPAHSVVQVTHDGAAGWAFRSRAVAGTFFQFSKGGHTARVINWVNIQTGLVLLGRLRNIFTYVRQHIGDGQGFFQNEDGGNIWFIDINLAGTTPNAQDVVATINARIAELQAPAAAAPVE